MTKDEAVALKDGDTIYLIDDLFRDGLRRIVIGEPGRNYGNKPIHVFHVTGYLVNAAVSREFGYDLFFTDRQAALIAFETHIQKMRDSLTAQLAKLDSLLIEANTLVHH